MEKPSIKTNLLSSKLNTVFSCQTLFKNLFHIV